LDDLLKNKKLGASFMDILSQAGVTAASAASGTASLPTKTQVDLLFLMASVYPKNALVHRQALVDLVMADKVVVRALHIDCNRGGGLKQDISPLGRSFAIACIISRDECSLGFLSRLRTRSREARNICASLGVSPWTRVFLRPSAGLGWR